MVELLPATAHESWRRPEGKFVAAPNSGSGSGDCHPIDENVSGHDQRPSPRAVLGKPTRHERFIKTSPLARPTRLFDGGLMRQPGTGTAHSAHGRWQRPGICGIIGMRSVRQTENQADHLLYLGLISFPIANHRLLDLRWGISATGTSRCAAASRTVPRACPTVIAVVTFWAKKRISPLQRLVDEIDQLANGGVNHE